MVAPGVGSEGFARGLRVVVPALSAHRAGCPSAGGLGLKVRHPDEVVACDGELEPELVLFLADIAQLPGRSDRLEPAEAFLDPLADALTDPVALMARGASMALARREMFWAMCGVTCTSRQPLTNWRVS